MQIKSFEIKGSRKLALIDVENLAGSPHLTDTQAIGVFREFQLVFPLHPRDVVYVGGHPGNALPCGQFAALAHGSLCLRRGRDGAEIALCERAMQVPHWAFESTIYPITECVIGSGDHYFVDFARSMTAKGVHVTVISRTRCLSGELASAANRVVYLDHSGSEIRKAA